MKKDIGVVYSDSYDSVQRNYINFCGKSLLDDSYLFVEKPSKIIKVRHRDHDQMDLVEQMTDIQNLLFWQEDQEGNIYLLDRDSKALFLGSKPVIDIKVIGEFSPLYMKIFQDKIIITCIPAFMLIYSRTNFHLLHFINLKQFNFIEPIWVEPLEDNSYLIVDSSTHVVQIIDNNGKTLWIYGTWGNPGSQNQQLFIPVSAKVLSNGNILVAEQRNHRVIEISREGKVVAEYGKNGWVGSIDDLLWAPNIADVRDNEKEVILSQCKGANINLVSVNIETKKIRSIFGSLPIIKSELNFPRACDWSDINLELLVCDTGHNRILIYDLKGRIINEIENTSMGRLFWPRCAKWFDGNILIADSRNRRVLIVDREGTVIKAWYSIFEGVFPNSEWFQCAEIRDNKLLVASETVVAIYSILLKIV